MPCKFLSITMQVMLMAVVLSLFVLIVGFCTLVILHLCVVGRAVGMGMRRRGGAWEGDVVTCGGENRGLSPEDIETIPCFDFDASRKGSGGVDCPVCLDNFESGDRCRMLPICGHTFHADCIDSWLRRSSACPVCRRHACTVDMGS